MPADNAKWADLPVTLEEIDSEGVKSLRANDSNKYRLINVWSTTCAPCVQEFPILAQVSRRMGLRPFELITISTDLPKDKAKAEAFLKKSGLGLPKHLERSVKKEDRKTNSYLFKEASMDGFIQALDPEWEGPQPHAILVKPGGEIAFRHTGIQTKHELLDKIIDEMGPYFPKRK